MACAKAEAGQGMQHSPSACGWGAGQAGPRACTELYRAQGPCFKPIWVSPLGGSSEMEGLAHIGQQVAEPECSRRMMLPMLWM